MRPSCSTRCTRSATTPTIRSGGKHLRLNVRADGLTWDDLAECEEARRYDPSTPENGMQRSYVLYRQARLEGVGGLRWTYSVTIWATAPPEVWTHPTDQPAGLDSDEDLSNDVEQDPDPDRPLPIPEERHDHGR